MSKRALSKQKSKGSQGKSKLIKEAKFILSPELGSTRGIYAVEGRETFGQHTDVNALIAVLREQTTALQSGDSGHMEALLISQATILQQMFVSLLERAGDQERIANMESFYRLALKAQSQCRITLHTLAEVKNPPTIYARQANIAHGPQQINNSSGEDPKSPRARKNPKLQNKLMEDRNGKRMDTGKACPTGRTDSTMETVGEIDRTKDRRR